MTEQKWQSWLFRVVAFGLPLVVLIGVFIRSQQLGGQIWDEQLDYSGVAEQLSVVGRILAGDFSASFAQVRWDYAFYGIVAVLPAYVAERAATDLGFPDPPAVFSHGLHAAAFLSYLLTAAATYLILLRATGSRRAAWVGAGLLTLYPLWLGFSFFNHKDVPTAGFVTLALLAGVGLLQSEGDKAACRRHASLLALATVLLAGLKLPAMVLVLPVWAAAAYVLLRSRFLGLGLALCAATALGVFLVTPVAWTDPVNFAIRSFELMSNHSWSGCTLAAGAQMCTNRPEWSAARYMATWYMAQLPLLIGVGALLAVLFAPWAGRVQALIAAMLAVPLVLIGLRNSTLYDGVRHLLFTLPPIFILASMFWYEIGRRAGFAAINVSAAALAGLFVWDNVAMFPSNYVYFNLPTRMIADDSNFETDFWGYSLKEAARLPVVRDPAAAVIANPKHLVEPYLEETHPVVVWPGEAGGLPRQTEPIMVSYMRAQPVPANCRDPEFVTRRLLLGRELRMSFAARCVMR